MRCRIVGAPEQDGAGHLGCEMGPSALRTAGLISALTELGHEVEDLGTVQPAAAQPITHRNPALKKLPEKPLKPWRKLPKKRPRPQSRQLIRRRKPLKPPRKGRLKKLPPLWKAQLRKLQEKTLKLLRGNNHGRINEEGALLVCHPYLLRV